MEFCLRLEKLINIILKKKKSDLEILRFCNTITIAFKAKIFT